MTSAFHRIAAGLKEAVSHAKEVVAAASGREEPRPATLPSRTTTDRVLARLEAEAPELHAAVQRGEMSANQAAISLGWRKPKDRFREMCLAYDRGSEDERVRFVAWLNANRMPDDRRSEYD